MGRLPRSVGVVRPFVLHALVSAVQDRPHHGQATWLIQVRYLENFKELLRPEFHLSANDRSLLRVRQAVQLLSDLHLFPPTAMLVCHRLTADPELV